jgi:hypothetical protein
MGGKDGKPSKEPFEVACREARQWLYDAVDAKRAGHIDEVRACLANVVRHLLVAAIEIWKEGK